MTDENNEITPEINEDEMKEPENTKVDGLVTYDLISSIVILLCIIGILSAVAVPRFHKPAIYLYPEKPTEVNIKLDKAIKISINIPKYHSEKGWNVLAHPNGRIKDLQPELTDCTKIDPTRFGLEYAQKACVENNYPYVYWDGIQTMKLLPDSDKGWVVKKEELKSFFEEKLSYVGFNDSEKAEFLAYWVPKLSAMKEQEFFIYFLQTEEIEKYLPMSVTPEPDSLNRFYLVAKKSASKHQNHEPQELKKFERKGFTLVDWGGIVSD